jgi:hypothetical protein
MNNLFDKWKTKIPKYSEEFKSSLFEPLSNKGSGAHNTMISLGKHFANNYELYIYAFFLGLYNDEFSSIEDVKKTDFGYAIQYWGSKGNRLDRKDFTILQEYIFSALIAKTDVDLLALDKANISDEEVIKSLLTTMEGYTNGGLHLIKEKLDVNPNYILQPAAFLDMILETKNEAK